MSANPPVRETYMFGDSQIAARRLRLLAEVFAPSTREFLERFVPWRPARVLDLGCGPGHTTRLLAEVFAEALVRGLDSSAQFIELARRDPAARVSFAVADVTRPLERGPWDLVYCRYLLTHVSQPEAAVALWSERLSPRGLIVIEENDWIHADEPAFARYLEIVAAMLASQGQQLYVGAQLDRLAACDSLVKTSSEVVPIVATDRDAAAMFRMNIHAWRRQPFVQQHYTAAELDRLERDLEEISSDESGRSSIAFGRRRLVLAKGDVTAGAIDGIRPSL